MGLVFNRTTFMGNEYLHCPNLKDIVILYGVEGMTSGKNTETAKLNQL